MWLLERSLQRTLPRASRIIRSNWIAQNNFLGGYSFMSMASASNNVSPRDLAEPVSNAFNQVLFFAGEATDDFYAYANGAVASGYRAGDAVSRLVS